MLNYIRIHGHITSMEAFEKLKITRLSGRIHDLRQQGYPIEMHYETSEGGTQYGVYTLNEP